VQSSFATVISYYTKYSSATEIVGFVRLDVSQVKMGNSERKEELFRKKRRFLNEQLGVTMCRQWAECSVEHENTTGSR